MSNFQAFEVVSRGSEEQLQMAENLNKLLSRIRVNKDCLIISTPLTNCCLNIGILLSTDLQREYLGIHLTIASWNTIISPYL